MRRSRKIFAAAFALGLLAASSSLSAASPSLSGGRISLTGVSNAFTAVAVTSVTGAKIENLVPPGTYKVTVALDTSDPKIRAVAADVYVEVEVGGRQVSCTRADLTANKPYATALLVDAASAQSVVVHLVPVPPKVSPLAVPERRGVND
jgi:hypothetical protein